MITLNRLVEEFCRQHKYIYVATSAVVDSAGFFESELSDDSVYPNKKGLQVMAPVARKRIGQALHSLQIRN